MTLTLPLAYRGHVELAVSEQEPGTPKRGGMGVHRDCLWVRFVGIGSLPDGWHRAQWTASWSRWKGELEARGGYPTGEMQADCWEGEARRRGWTEREAEL